jgi:hypothetical protein
MKPNRDYTVVFHVQAPSLQAAVRAIKGRKPDEVYYDREDAPERAPAIGFSDGHKNDYEE